ncbi:hypothetical protein FSP39_015111 [Pinctada imbricata]|uniref:Uncharacterized protein n=1 Tax=Pinctada imbricata TaxID=66713 RepID=A0AA88XLN0_PINIB|nr:hypothetical protein FSP39_015111 [Pinctada imbricata]
MCAVRQHQQDSEEKDFSVQLQNALEPAVCLHTFPKAQINVFVHVLQNDGSALAAAITAASVAIATAGIEMYDLVAVCSAVRVYFLNKTPCALQWAIQNEANFDGKLMCPEKAFLFYGNTEDIRINLRYLSDKWEKVDDDDYDRVQYLHVWHGKCPHVSMCFRKKDAVVPNKELNFSLYVYQDTIDNEGEKLVVHATESSDETAGNNELLCHKHGNDHSTVIVNFPLVRPDTPSKVEIKRSKTDSESSVAVLAGSKSCHCDLENMTDFSSSLPYSCKMELRKRLDPENPMGNNWKAFIEKLGHGNCIEYIQSLRGSPTDICLAQAERQGMTTDDIKVLYIFFSFTIWIEYFVLI